MARLADDAINTIKRDISLVRLVQSQGYALKKHGKDYALSCPFHKDDQTASCVITPSSNLFHCFGCGAAGSVVDWVMKTQGVSFRFACEILQKDLGLVAENTGQPVKQNTTTKLPPLSASTDNQTALSDVINYYHDTLKQAPEAQEYLRSRGLDNIELIERFKLGFANRTLGYHLPEKNRKAGAELRGKLQEIGILRDSGHEHFNGSLVVPIMDAQGVITEVYGRKIQGNKLRKGTAQHLYLPGAHDGVWNVQGWTNAASAGSTGAVNIEAFTAAKEIILCEALIDAMTFWVHGFRNVTASYGTSGFTASHLAAFKQYEIKRVLIAYDRDEAGNNAAEALAKKLMAEGIDCYRINLPKGMDVNEYAQQVTPAVKSLGLVIRKAEWMGNGQAPERQEDIEIQTAVVPVLAAKEPPPENESKETLAPTLPESTQASPLPDMPSIELDAEVTEHEIKITLGKRLYRIRGLQKNMSYEQMKINLLVSQGEAVHVDQLELYNSKGRQQFIKQASIELGVKDDVIKKDLGKVLLKLEALQDENIKNTLEKQTKKEINLTDKEQRAALEYLQDPSLLSRLLLDFETCGVVGEAVNKQVAYLAAVSRKLENPLAVMVQSSSAAGKSSLMEAVLAFMPEEERIQYSAMTGQALFYMGEQDLKHKILAIAEEEGASNASYALKLLQSEGEVSIASTGKNDTTGNLETKTYKVEGPVMLFSTTTAIDLDEELLNRCITLSVDESREQTQAIHVIQRQRRTLEGQRARKDKKTLIQRHQNAQRLLRSLGVINPYADQLTFLSDKTRMRRDHEKYLGLIDSIALLHQYQREIVRDEYDGETSEYVAVTLEDIAIANQLAHEVLGRTLDELPPQTRKLLNHIHAMVLDVCQQENIARCDCRFTRKQLRDYSGWGNTQLKVHLDRLEDMEYLITHNGSRGKTITYELIYNGEGDHRNTFVMGLIDIEKLRYDNKKTGLEPVKSGPKRPLNGLVTGLVRGDKKPENTTNAVLNGYLPQSSEITTIKENNDSSHRNHTAMSTN